jgi:hypothetical protein
MPRLAQQRRAPSLSSRHSFIHAVELVVRIPPDFNDSHAPMAPCNYIPMARRSPVERMATCGSPISTSANTTSTTKMTVLHWLLLWESLSLGPDLPCAGPPGMTMKIEFVPGQPSTCLVSCQLEASQYNRAVPLPSAECGVRGCSCMTFAPPARCPRRCHASHPYYTPALGRGLSSPLLFLVLLLPLLLSCPALLRSLS